ncbi:hypothetical protein ABK040_014661 [Willaertia magna]
MLSSSQIKIDPLNKKCSLAFQQLRDIPGESVFINNNNSNLKEREKSLKILKEILELDLSHNNLTDINENINLFENLNSLVLDHNRLHSNLNICGGKVLNKITLLWVNSNKIKDLVPFILKISQQFPNLKIFSMLKNEACPNYFSGGTMEQYEQYRLFVISKLKNLTVLDTTPVTKSEREIGEKMYGNSDAIPMFIVMKQQLQNNTLQQNNGLQQNSLQNNITLQQNNSGSSNNLNNLQQNNENLNLPSIENLQQNTTTLQNNNLQQNYDSSSEEEEDLLAVAHSIGNSIVKQKRNLQNKKIINNNVSTTTSVITLPSIESLQKNNFK